MAYPPTPTLAVAAVPPIKAYSDVYNPAVDGPKVSPAYVQGQTLASDDLNQTAAQSDAVARGGGGAWGVIPGLGGLGCDLSAGSGLTLNIANGAVMCDGWRYIAAQSIVLTPSIARIWIWMSQSGAPLPVNVSLTPPAGAYVLLGSAVTGASTITSVDFSGVLYVNGQVAHRYTLNSGLPADAPPSNLTFEQHQYGDGTLWQWDGAGWWDLSAGGGGGPVAIADGGTGATTAPAALANLGAAPLGVKTVNPSNGTNTVSAADSQASTIILTGGTASAEFTLELTTNGSPAVRDGHEWTIINKTSYGVKIVRNGSGLGSCWLGQGSANDQRGHFVFERDGSGSGEIRRIAKDYPSYISRVITGTLTATRGQIEAGFQVIGAQTGSQLASLPNTGGFEGQVTAYQADIANYPLTVETSGETQPAASMTLLPGLVRQVVQDAAGRHWPIGRQEREVTINFPSNANYTLAPGEALATTIIMQDTGVLLSTGRDVIWAVQQSAAGYEWQVENQTLQSLVFKPSGHAGVTVATGKTARIRINAGLDMRRLTADVTP